MPKRDVYEQRVRSLLAQDRELSETRMQEFRMQLEEKLEACERTAKLTRRRIVLAVTVYCIVLTLYMLSMSLFGDGVGESVWWRWRQFVFIPLFITGLATVVIGMLLVGLYLFRYLPQLARTRFELQTTMLLELQQRVAELGERIERRGE